MTIRDLFPTRIYEASLAGDRRFDTFNADLLDACLMLADEDEAGQRWCADKGYPGYTSYASLDDLPRRATVFADLKRKLDRHAAAYAEALNLDLDGRALKLDSLWANVLDRGGAHSGHIHPHSVISGTLYVATPGAAKRNAGALKLEDPRLSRMMARPLLGPGAPEAERNFVYIQPAPGTLLMWESWLRHEVTAHAGREPRVSISFNYAWR